MHYRTDNTVDKHWKTEVPRALCAAIIIQALRDFHAGREVCRKHKISSKTIEKKYHGLPPAERKAVMDGVRALSWLRQAPLDEGEGLTLDECLDVVSMTRAELKRCMLPEVGAALPKLTKNLAKNFRRVHGRIIQPGSGGGADYGSDLRHRGRHPGEQIHGPC